MALGRGGDQAAVKTDNGFEFYGGVSKGVESVTQRSRHESSQTHCLSLLTMQTRYS